MTPSDLKLKVVELITYYKLSCRTIEAKMVICNQNGFESQNAILSKELRTIEGFLRDLERIWGDIDALDRPQLSES